MPRFVTSARIKSTSKRAKWVLGSAMAVAAINFLIFWIIAVDVGGDAVNGYEKAGHYFVCAHGACREVSQAFWRYSYWHSISSMVGIFLVFVVAAILVNTGDIVLDFDARA